MTELLRVEGLTKNFGGLPVSSNVTFSLQTGERTALIGPNGAGKTTLVNLISGTLRPSSGNVFLEGKQVTQLNQAARTRAGIVRTFQVGRLCRDLTVLENVRLPLIQRRRIGFRFWPSRSTDEEIDAEAHDLLRGLGLEGLQTMTIARLAYGQQRLVEIAIALALEPRVLLLDEPAAGVPESESSLIFDVIDQLPAELPVLLIEHDMDLVFRFARRVIVLVSGAILTEGTSSEVAADCRVRDIYFGRAAHGLN